MRHKGIERCPHCVAPPLVARIHPLGYGEVFLECMDCGYYEGVTRRPTPPRLRDRVYRDHNGRLRRRHRHLPGTTHQGKRSA